MSFAGALGFQIHPRAIPEGNSLKTQTPAAKKLFVKVVRACLIVKRSYFPVSPVRNMESLTTQMQPVLIFKAAHCPKKLIRRSYNHGEVKPANVT